MAPPVSDRLQLRAEWLAHRYDAGHDAIQFVKADRELRRKVPFLTDEHLPAAKEPLPVSRKDAMAAAPAPSPIHFIFHSAYCCSTLLANAFDLPGVSTSFKEPTILNDVVGWRHQGAEPRRVGEVLDNALTLLARPFEPGEASIVKPSNVLNGLAPAMLTLRPAASCVMLYAPLEVFLGSIASKGLWGRLWVRELLYKQLKDGFIDLGFAPEDHFLQSDLQVAAVGWLGQHQLFSRLAAQHPGRVRTCSSEDLLDRPLEALEAAAELFGLSPERAMLDDAVARVFTRHAKFGGAFTRDDRLQAQREATKLHGLEIEKVLGWADAVAQNAGVALDPPSPLLA